jgi:hypothetical protein
MDIWALAMESDAYYGPPTIKDWEFLEKYAQNTTPDEKPKWVFETDKELKDFVAEFLASKSQRFDLFLASKRFSLTCVDGVVTDPEQVVYYIHPSIGIQNIAAKNAEKTGAVIYLSKFAAETALKIGTRYIALGDMVLTNGWYAIKETDAEQLFKERNP